MLSRYLSFFPERLRTKATNVLDKSTVMVDGWMKSVVIVGLVEGISATIFLFLMGIPGALVWGAFAFFAELIPKVSGYLMAIPPILVALAIDPIISIWVAIFYMAINEFASDFISPKVRSSTMNIHPVFSIFMLLAMTSLFGILGALISAPVSGFVKAYWDEFYTGSKVKKAHIDKIEQSILQ